MLEWPDSDQPQATADHTVVAGRPWWRRPGSGYGLLSTLVGTRPLTIGRSSRCELVLSDETVSRRHATLVRDGDSIFVTDLGSTNGTLINGRRVIQAEVRPGDRLQLGRTALGL